jgi:hypothetical protein
MSAGPDKKEVVTLSHHLAIRIYVELVARNTTIVEGSVKMAASATNLAALSLKLAEAFIEAEDQAIADKAPITTYKLEGSDIAAWLK